MIQKLVDVLAAFVLDPKQEEELRIRVVQLETCMADYPDSSDYADWNQAWNDAHDNLTNSSMAKKFIQLADLETRTRSQYHEMKSIAKDFGLSL